MPVLSLADQRESLVRAGCLRRCAEQVVARRNRCDEGTRLVLGGLEEAMKGVAL
ncbi:MAG: hypothetical protein HY763_13830 [Planctomycetes bacterium]|nr:hypothetical protein [Planctomycetota bacterium]